ncbi:hypothetical protein H5410_003571 [Solanum commersonii]|uniref:Uncharacterized protein n=1 Tax=Solanum commersonii TaxID=4109 RepID=A0A9J6B530_SOLCO|nr:hypothetical protein H5410_003571 [Solanum commersonii]
MQLVEIVDALGSPPFGLFHRPSALALRISAFWIIGRYSTTLRNSSTTHRLCLFITDMIFSFRAQNTGTLGEVKTFGDSLNALGYPQLFFSLSF